MSDIPGNFAPQGRDIIARILKERKLKASDFFSSRHTHALMDARIQATREMKVIGYSNLKISRVIGRDRRTVRHYLSEDMHELQRARMLRSRMLSPYPHELGEMVMAIAETRGVEVRALLNEWISDCVAHAMRRHAA